jgi:hypothetical protein
MKNKSKNDIEYIADKEYDILDNNERKLLRDCGYVWLKSYYNSSRLARKNPFIISIAKKLGWV